MNPNIVPEKQGREEGQAPASSAARSARSLEDETNSNDSLQGYAAMNAVDEHSEIAQEAASETSDDREEIARLAYQYHEERGGHHGSHEEDWFRAEQVIRERRASRTKSDPHKKR